jgi:hypothetical protein
MDKPLPHLPYSEEYRLPKTKYGVEVRVDQFVSGQFKVAIQTTADCSFQQRDNKFECDGKDAEDDGTQWWKTQWLIDEKRAAEERKARMTAYFDQEAEWIEQHKQKFATNLRDAKLYGRYLETNRMKVQMFLNVAAEKSVEQQKADMLNSESQARFSGFSFSAVTDEMETVPWKSVLDRDQDLQEAHHVKQGMQTTANCSLRDDYKRVWAQEDATLQEQPVDDETAKRLREEKWKRVEALHKEQDENLAAFKAHMKERNPLLTTMRPPGVEAPPRRRTYGS